MNLNYDQSICTLYILGLLRSVVLTEFLTTYLIHRLLVPQHFMVVHCSPEYKKYYC